MKKKRRLKSIRIELPKGIYYDTLQLGASLHGAPSLSKYLITAAMSYTKQFLETKRDEIDARAVVDSASENSPEQESPEDSTEHEDH